MSRVKISDGSSAPKKEPKEPKLKSVHKAIIGICAGVIVLCVCAVGFLKDYRTIEEKNAYTITADDPATIFQGVRE